MREILKKFIWWILPHKMLISLLGLPIIIRLRNDPFLRKAYYCKALSGESNYNICINSDMTVSCNCWDYDGQGHMGDLNGQTLEQIFHGDVAQGFRRKLSRGYFAIPHCAECWELQVINKRDAGHYLVNYHVPQLGIMVENTVLCNLKCIGCPRDEVMKVRKRASMSLEDLEQVAKMIRDYHIKSVAFHNLGEPFVSKTIFEEISIIRKYNPNISLYTSTNGLLLNSERKREAATLMDHIYFSIDGPSREIAAKYQARGDFEKAYDNIKELVDFRFSINALTPVIEWKYVVFSWNDSEEAIESAIELAKEARVDIISFWLGFGKKPQMSQRYLHDPYFKRLGKETWKGREIDLRKNFLSLKAFGDLGDEGSTANSLYHSGLNYQSKGEYKKALVKYKQILNLLEDLGDNQATAFVYGKIGESYESDVNYKEAIKNYIFAYKVFKSLRSAYKEIPANDLRRIKYLIGEEALNSHLNEITKELNFTLESIYK